MTKEGREVIQREDKTRKRGQESGRQNTKQARKTNKASQVKPQSHWSVRLFDRTIVGDLARLRLVSEFFYDLSLRSHTTTAFTTGRTTGGAIP